MRTPSIAGSGSDPLPHDQHYDGLPACEEPIRICRQMKIQFRSYPLVQANIMQELIGAVTNPSPGTIEE
ncbi:hypothetical protein K7432_009287 [Basidiobolus ranarum]|uniref:Uncharacterized protein n=1 Tax=Basidiobolus ranarum TaxID=34480 RepID=A0ABR2VXB2_9FUNG